MKCSKAHKLISPYIDRELTEQDKQTVEDHMKVCDKCRADFEDVMKLHNLFTSADTFKAPYGFHTRVMANINPDKIRVNSKISAFARLAEAVAIIMVLTFGILSGSLVVKGKSTDNSRDIAASFSLDIFDAAPPGSLGGVYLAMTEARNEK